jgi:hypothetical protein
MIKNSILTGFTAAGFSALICSAQAASADLSQLVSACESNVLCSNETTGDGTLFKLRLPQHTNSLLCRDDGSCEVLLARGQKIKVEDAFLRLKAK